MSGSTGGPRLAFDRWWVQWGAIGLLSALVADVLFNVDVEEGENGGTGPMLVVGAILVVLAAALYLVVFPRFANSANAALVTGIVSVVLLAVFWSALTLLVAPAAFAYGLRSPASTAARVGMGLAGAAALLDIIGAVAAAV